MSVLSRQSLKIILLTLSSFVISLVLFLSNVLNFFELKAFDQFSRLLNPAKSSAPIVIVQIDQQSIDALSGQSINWPWPREMYVPILEYLSEADAVFIDIFFTEPSFYGQEDDTRLVNAVKSASHVYLPIFLSRQEKTLSTEEEAFIKRIALQGDIPANLSFNSVITPVGDLKEAIHGAGNVMITPDEDGVYRRVPLTFQLNQQVLPHFLLGYLIERGTIKIEQGALYTGDSPLPLKDGKLILRYYRGHNPFETFSFVEILQAYMDSQASTPPSITKEFFKGKVVLIGPTAAGLYDLKATSTSSISTGVHVHATTLDNIINRSFIRPTNPFVVIASMVFICFAISYGVLRTHSLYVNLSLFLIFLSLVLGILAFLFKKTLYVEVVPLMASLLVSFIVSFAYSYATEGKQRLFLKRTFSQYMDQKVADYLLKNPSLIKPGGQLKRVTVFFADIAGFTTMSEMMEADQLAMQLHRVLNAFTEVIIQNHGVIDKYIGDCIMAFWGAPVSTEQDEINACQAAIQCMEALREINQSFQAEELPRINIRIGLHSGDAIAGNIGSDRLFHYTVIGDTVNLASRLESANKFSKTNIMVSEDTLKETENRFFSRELGLIAVKGKTVPVKIFELIGEEDHIQSDIREKIKDYHQSLSFYKDQKWSDALKGFNELLQKYPGDSTTEYYKKQCEEYLTLNSTLTGDWSVIKMTEK
jgi:adenylate cyclase